MSDRSKLAVRILRSLKNLAVFFVIISFVITCCMFLFIYVLQHSMGIILTQDNIQLAAKLTFANVIILSLLCTLIDAIRRKYMIERPVKRITTAAQRLMQGDLSARIEPMHSYDTSDGFDEIIDYFNRMAQELSGMETLRTDFIANVSHELKTPLAVMQNYGTMLQRPDLTQEERIDYAKSITDASRRLSTLITNILKLNKLENQQIHPLDETFDLGEQLCECLLDFEDVWEEKNIEIETDVEELVLIKSDAELLSVVWNNLFSNAIKFTPEGGRVSLKLRLDGEYATVRVSDTGCGISREAGEHIFEKFFQGDISHSSKGNGLGLALVKRVVDIVCGDISVESEVGRGSIFTVKLRRNV